MQCQPHAGGNRRSACLSSTGGRRVANQGSSPFAYSCFVLPFHLPLQLEKGCEMLDVLELNLTGSDQLLKELS